MCGQCIISMNMIIATFDVCHDVLAMSNFLQEKTSTLKKHDTNVRHIKKNISFQVETIY